jgi:hypothetical protein
MGLYWFAKAGDSCTLVMHPADKRLLRSLFTITMFSITSLPLWGSVGLQKPAILAP